MTEKQTSKPDPPTREDFLKAFSTSLMKVRDEDVILAYVANLEERKKYFEKQYLSLSVKYFGLLWFDDEIASARAEAKAAAETFEVEESEAEEWREAIAIANDAGILRGDSKDMPMRMVKALIAASKLGG